MLSKTMRNVENANDAEECLLRSDILRQGMNGLCRCYRPRISGEYHHTVDAMHICSPKRATMSNFSGKSRLPSRPFLLNLFAIPSCRRQHPGHPLAADFMLHTHQEALLFLSLASCIARSAGHGVLAAARCENLQLNRRICSTQSTFDGNSCVGISKRALVTSRGV